MPIYLIRHSLNYEIIAEKNAVQALAESYTKEIKLENIIVDTPEELRKRLLYMGYNKLIRTQFNNVWGLIK